MPGPRPQPIKLKRKQRVILKQLSRRRQTPHALVQRAQIILLAEEGWSNSEIAAHLNLHERRFDTGGSVGWDIAPNYWRLKLRE